MTPGERAEQNLIQVFGIWSRAAGGAQWEGDGLTCVSSTVRKRAFNHIFVTSERPNVDALREAVEGFGANGLPLRARARPELGVGDVMARVGLHLEGAMPAMSLSEPPSPAVETNLRIERVNDERTLADLRAVVGGSFDWTEEQLAPIFHPGIVGEPGWFAWVGYAGDEPAASSQLVIHDGTAGLYHIATSGRHRKKGYGGAITHRAVLEGQAQGCDMTTLYASALGYPVYKRLGFEDAGEYLTYRPD